MKPSQQINRLMDCRQLVSSLIITTVLLGGISTQAQAQSSTGKISGIEVGAAIGLSRVDVDVDDSLDVTDDRDTAWQLMLGYRFNRQWQVNLSYSDLGESTIDFTADVDHDVTALSVAYSLPLWETTPWSLFVAGGIASVNSDSDDLNLEDDSETEFHFGLGASYRHRQWSVNWAYNSYNSDLTSYTIGLVRRF